MTSASPVRVDRREPGRLRIVIDRPKGNIITMEVVTCLRGILGGVGLGERLKLVTIEGAGPDFSYGASVEEHAPEVVGAMLPAFHGLVRELIDVPAPTAAVVRGRCLGGGFELALACDFVFASDDAVLGVPEISLGVFPPAAAVLLPVRVGTSRATGAILTGEGRCAREWQDAGLVSWTAPAAQLEVEVEQWFDEHLAAKSAMALSHAALATRIGARAAVHGALGELEQRYLGPLMRTRDAAEGVRAFLEKRLPVWSDA